MRLPHPSTRDLVHTSRFPAKPIFVKPVPQSMTTAGLSNGSNMVDRVILECANLGTKHSGHVMLFRP